MDEVVVITGVLATVALVVDEVVVITGVLATVALVLDEVVVITGSLATVALVVDEVVVITGTVVTTALDVVEVGCVEVVVAGEILCVRVGLAFVCVVVKLAVTMLRVAGFPTLLVIDSE